MPFNFMMTFEVHIINSMDKKLLGNVKETK